MRDRLYAPALLTIVLLGLCLRIWSARGGLWVDEAWSAVFAARAGTPLGVFLEINHDNNHHFNSLWMQMWGLGASPLALRSLSIATGTLTIFVAGAIGARQGVVHALVAALLFAVSPILVNYGSEARGYAPMLLAAMMMIWRVAWVLDDPRRRSSRTAWGLGGLALLGLFSQLTMLFFVLAIVAWTVWVTARRMPIDAALGSTIRLLLPSLGACLLAVGTTFGAAALSTTGMQVGDYSGFSRAVWATAMTTMVSSTLGLPDAERWIVMVPSVVVVWLGLRARNRRSIIGPFAIVASIFPLLFPLLEIGNSGFPRYFLLTAVAILLLAADGIAYAFVQPRGASRWNGCRWGGVWAMLGLGAIVVASLCDDLAQAALRRGDPGAAIATMAARAPRGTSVMVDHLRPVAVLRVAAAEARYPLAIGGGCPARRFLQVDLSMHERAFPTTVRCGRRYRRLVVRRSARLSGVDWALYERAGS
ncbi:hypothetical protein C8J47_3690 [Sphingomonas sp. PP-F2F-G114-C0414]|uniref:hypothetical protein n=1 Tax=Sphingomonas sp. PP-F2F-G114-C0414 TaxID=2135662 RepID=UPI000F14BDB5|nr:hypothetical protein [Sphingomonas sp. PP-F2F-G114-C0414]RMB25741.1 hypothetical protein C8J47_3690 [Sphingomonas sp. PP-F2F-G114-C0414]